MCALACAPVLLAFEISKSPAGERRACVMPADAPALVACPLAFIAVTQKYALSTAALLVAGAVLVARILVIDYRRSRTLAVGTCRKRGSTLRKPVGPRISSTCAMLCDLLITVKYSTERKGRATEVAPQ